MACLDRLIIGGMTQETAHELGWRCVSALAARGDPRRTAPSICADEIPDKSGRKQSRLLVLWNGTKLICGELQC